MQNLRLNLVNINSLIICLIPFFALTGPFLPDLSIVIVDLLFLYICLKENKWGFFKNKFFKIFLIFYFYLVLISFFSDNIFHSLSSSIFYVRFGIFTLALYYVINEDKSFITKFSSYFLITMIFASGFNMFVLIALGIIVLGIFLLSSALVVAVNLVVDVVYCFLDPRIEVN